MLRKIESAFQNSLHGLKLTWQHEKAFRLEVIGCTGVLLFIFFWGGSPLKQLFVIFSLGLVLITELLNTGLEKANDALKKDHDPLVQFSKDAGSAAVLISLLLVGVSLGYLVLG